MNHLKIRYGLEKHWREVLSFAAAVVSAFIAFVFSAQAGYAFGISVLSTVISSSIAVYFLLRQKELYFLALDRYSYEEDWFGSGTFKFDKTNKAYKVADTDAGFIFSKCLNWSNYTIGCDFKIQKSHLGIIIRAIDLSNYIMIQIGKQSIRPHYRTNGGWLIREVNETGLDLERRVKDGIWYKLELTINKEEVQIKIYDKKGFLIDKIWPIRKGYSLITVPVFPVNDDRRQNHTHNLDIPVSYDYGSIGFRNGHGESAVVKNLLIKSL